MGKSGRPAKGNVKMTAYVSPETKLAIQKEALTRNMTIGDVIEESMHRRITLVTKR